MTNPGFNGQEQAGGLVYMRNRWYDPNTGRFTQQDPIGYGGGINLYAYVGGDPVNYSDPFGLCGTKPGEVPCAVTYGLAGGAIGTGLGVLAATATTVGTLGAAAPAIPAEVVGGSLAGAAIGTFVGRALDHPEQVTAEMSRLSRTLGKYILIGLGALHPGGAKAVPQDVRRVKKRDASIEQEATPEKPRGAGEPPKEPKEPK